MAGKKAGRSAWADTLVRELLDDGMTTSGIDLAHLRLPAGDRRSLARQAFEAYLALDLGELEPADVWKFAPSMTYLFGPEVARAGFAAVPAGRGGRLRMMLEAALELPAAAAAIPAPAEVDGAAAAGLKAMAGELPDDPLACLELLLPLPRDARPDFASLLVMSLPAPAREAMGALGFLTPALGPPARAALARDLARDRDPAALAFLADVPAAQLGAGLAAYVRKLLMQARWDPALRPAPLAMDPRRWPVFAAYGSEPDGAGSRATYVLRHVGQARFALFGVVENEARGAVDGAVRLDVEAFELAEVRDALLGATPPMRPMPIPAAARRMGAAIAQARSLGHPVPFEVALGESLLAGAEAAPVVAPAGAPRSKPAPKSRVSGVAARPVAPVALVGTGDLIHAQAAAALRLKAADGPAARAFLDEAVSLVRKLERGKRSRGARLSFPEQLARELDMVTQIQLAPATMKALLALAAGHAEGIFDATRREAWRAGLAAAEAASRKARKPAIAELAGAAAAALAPASGVPAAAQPFVLQAMVVSLFDHQLEDEPGDSEEERAFVAFISPVIDILPFGWPDAGLRDTSLALAAAWNAGIARAPMAAPLAQARAQLAAALPAILTNRGAILAAVDQLPRRFATTFMGVRRPVRDVEIHWIRGRLAYRVRLGPPAP